MQISLEEEDGREVEALVRPRRVLVALARRTRRRGDALAPFSPVLHKSNALLFLAVSMPRVWLRRPDACVSAADTWKQSNVEGEAESFLLQTLFTRMYCSKRAYPTRHQADDLGKKHQAILMVAAEFKRKHSRGVLWHDHL